MALGINTNVASLSAQNQLGNSQKMNDQALERLSSGLRINSAKDDAAGLAISTRFSAQISGQNVAQRNANDGISYAQTAEGALGEITNALSRIRDLAVQSANDTNSDSDREALNQETEALINEVNRIADSTQFNGQNVIDGSLEELAFQVGANAGQTINVEGVDTRGSQLGSEVFEGPDNIAQSDIKTLVDGDGLTINSESIDLTGVTTGDDLMKAINASSGDTGVEAVARLSTEANLGTLTSGTADTDVTINGSTITLSGSADYEAESDQNALVGSIEDKTGLSASFNSSNELILTDDEGSSIEVAVPDTTDGVAFGEVALDNSETYDVGFDLTTDIGEDIVVNGTTAEVDDVLGSDIGTSTTLDTDTDSLDKVDISTRQGASDAISTIDKALDQVNGTRAELGAVQTRFDSAISNLASSTENLSAANSRILDADFAAETANLAKSQVLQQAGISVLSQANARPQQVLSLLQ